MKLHEVLDITPHEEKHCLRKQRYPTLKQARLALLKCWKKGRKERSLYPCKYCKEFHLTKKKPSGIATT